GILVHPDHNGLTHNIGLRHHSPFAAVCTVVTIVTHHEIVTRRHYPAAAAIIAIVIGYNLGTMVGNAQLLVKEYSIAHTCGGFDQGLFNKINVNLFAVDAQNLVFVFDTVAWQSYYSLDEITRIVRRYKNHDLT